MMAVVMGVDPDDDATLDRACDLGLAFQLANIARDIEEDDRSGRCYLPEEWLVEMDFPPGQHMKPPFRARLAVLVAAAGDARRRAMRTARGWARPRWRSGGLGGAGGGRHLRRDRAQGRRGGRPCLGPPHPHQRGAKRSRRSRAAGHEALARERLYPPAPRDPDLWSRPAASTARTSTFVHRYRSYDASGMSLLSVRLSRALETGRSRPRARRRARAAAHAAATSAPRRTMLAPRISRNAARPDPLVAAGSPSGRSDYATAKRCSKSCTRRCQPAADRRQTLTRRSARGSPRGLRTVALACRTGPPETTGRCCAERGRHRRLAGDADA